MKNSMPGRAKSLVMLTVVSLLALGACGEDDAGDIGPGDGGADRCCLTETIDWGHNGGLRSWGAEAHLSGCDAYAEDRQSSGETRTVCEGALPNCGAPGVGADDLRDALGHPDVVSARRDAEAQGAVIYGRDERPVDGTAFRMLIGGDEIVLGAARDGEPLPEGLVALRELLEAVTAERQDACLPDCAEGEPWGPEPECTGVAGHSNDTYRCFADFDAACACVCDVHGAALDACLESSSYALCY